jgi:predicted amidohydrolase YtcJ
MIIVNGKIHTMENLAPFATALAAKDGSIIAVGNDDEIKRSAGPGTRIIDAGGNTVLPGLIDAHVHFLGTGLDAASAKLLGAESRKEFMDRLTEKESTLKPGVWLRGYGYDETKFKEGSLPSLNDLNAAFPTRPVLLSRIDAHSCFLNDKAYELLNVDPALEGVVTENGRRTGVLRAAANSFARRKLSDELTADDTRKEAMRLAADEALQAGITTLHALEGGSLFSEKDVDAMLRYADELPIRTLLYHQIPNAKLVKSEGLPRVGGCITVDGSLGSYTAALLEPYADKSDTCGVPYMSQGEIDDFVTEAHAMGMQITMHTIGDKAIEMLMSAYEKALAKYPRADHRHRFEHFTVPTYDQIARAAKLGVYISVQPSFDYLTKNMMALRLGPDRLRRGYPFRTIAEAGLVMAGGSDSNITPMSPLFGVTSCMVHSQPMQRLSLYESLKLFTVNAAIIGFEEDVKGSLKVGKYADITIIEGDITAVEPERIQYMKVLKTIVGGDIKYEAD